MSYTPLDCETCLNNMRSSIKDLQGYVDELETHEDDWDISHNWVKRVKKTLADLEDEI